MYWDGSAFKFEDDQYSFQSSWNTSHVSHFFWSKDARVAYSTSHSKANTQYGITPTVTDVFFTNETTETAKSNFTVNDVTGKYRTLSAEEWKYLFQTRQASTVSGVDNARYALATVNDIVGIIVLPDAYVHPSEVAVLTGINESNIAYTVNSYGLSDWEAIESAGAVFLPVVGYRQTSEPVVFFHLNDQGNYWSSSAYSENVNNAIEMYFDNSMSGWPNKKITSRGYAFCVRLVTDVPAAGDPGNGTEQYKNNSNPDWFN